MALILRSERNQGWRAVWRDHADDAAIWFVSFGRVWRARQAFTAGAQSKTHSRFHGASDRPSVEQETETNRQQNDDEGPVAIAKAKIVVVVVGQRGRRELVAMLAHVASSASERVMPLLEGHSGFTPDESRATGKAPPSPSSERVSKKCSSARARATRRSLRTRGRYSSGVRNRHNGEARVGSESAGPWRGHPGRTPRRLFGSVWSALSIRRGFQLLLARNDTNPARPLHRPSENRPTAPPRGRPPARPTGLCPPLEGWAQAAGR